MGVRWRKEERGGEKRKGERKTISITDI